MPANLTPDYLEAERRFKSAKTTEEKIAAIEEMMATIPRHKGTEKMQADLKRRLSKLRAEQARRPTSRAGIIHRVEKEGAGQVAMVGPPNSGKSLLVRRLTHAMPEVADYPFTTRVPLPGMMPFEDVQIQLVDLPPVHPDFPESWLYQIIRNADAALLVVDLSDPDLLEDLETTLGQVANAKVQLDQAELPSTPGWLRKRTLLVANKIDASGAPENLEDSPRPVRRAIHIDESVGGNRRRPGTSSPGGVRVVGSHSRLHQGAGKETGAHRPVYPQARLAPDRPRRPCPPGFPGPTQVCSTVERRTIRGPDGEPRSSARRQGRGGITPVNRSIEPSGH